MARQRQHVAVSTHRDHHYTASRHTGKGEHGVSGDVAVEEVQDDQGLNEPGARGALSQVRVPDARPPYMEAKMACATSVGERALVSINFSNDLRSRTAS